MSLNLTNLLQGIQNRLNFWTGPAASKQSGVVLLDTASVTWSHDEFGNITATAAGSGATGPANEVLATPNGSAGTAVLRVLVPADLPVGSSSQAGALQVDGTTITAAAGVISANGGGRTLIQKQSVTGQASVTFSGIPQTFSNLVLVFSGVGSGTGGPGVTNNFNLNGDSANNHQYSVVTWPYSSGSPGLAGAFGTNSCLLPTTAFELNIPGYNTGTQVQFFGIGTGNNVNGNMVQFAGQFNNNSNPITSIILTSPGGTLTGSFCLYGDK